MTREELFDIVRPIILKVTDSPECILANQSTNAPDGEYCSLEPFGGLSQIGRGQTKKTDVPAEDGNPDYKDIKETLETLIEARMSVNFYRGNAQERAHRLMFCDERSDIQDMLRDGNISWMRTGAVNNLTTLNAAKYEPRSQIDVYVRFTQTQTNTLQRIYSVGIEGYQTIDDADVKLISDNVTITED